jgi:hypothetical protein
MINVLRDPTVPTSLTTLDIQNYIDSAILYLNNPAANSKPEKPVSYRSSDLLDAFDRDFFAKCYLTEQKFANSYIMDIEHFEPQNARPDLVYTWQNLFPAEHNTNMIKPRLNPVGGYLNPCDPNDDVESEIIYTLSFYGDSPNFDPANPGNVKATNTCNLLNRVHNGHDQNTIKSTESLRFAIHKKYIEVLQKIIEWREAAENSQEQFQAKRELKDLLSRKSSYTMLIRSIKAVRQLPLEFFD